MNNPEEWIRQLKIREKPVQAPELRLLLDAILTRRKQQQDHPDERKRIRRFDIGSEPMTDGALAVFTHRQHLSNAPPQKETKPPPGQRSASGSGDGS
jgi:hypothetical protein